TDSNRRRVKVYELSGENQWVDKGTGLVSQQYVEVKEGFCMIVRSEEDSSVLLDSKIRKEDVYNRQQDTLIVWTEPNGTDLALSFQEAAGCTDIWNIILDIQRRLSGMRISTGRKFLNFRRLDISNADDVRNSGAFEIKSPALDNLKDVEQSFVVGCRTMYGREQLVNAIVQENYLSKLLPLLEICEDLESTEELFSLSNIMKIIIFLNDTKIYDAVLEDENFLRVVGMLEYDRDFPKVKANHRDHLTNNAHLKQVIPIPNKDIVARIQRVYRLQFLKDVALARLLDDQTFSSLNSLIFFNQVEIVNYFQQNQQYLAELFGMLNSESESDDKKRDVIGFFLELCSVVKNMQVGTRNSFYRSMGQHGLLSIFEFTLADSNVAVRLSATAILSSILDHDASLVRSFCLAQTKQSAAPLVEFIIGRFLEEPDLGLRSQLSEIIRILLDTSGLDSSEGISTHAAGDADSDEFLNLFFEKYMSKLAEPILALDYGNLSKEKDGTEVLILDESKATKCNFICEFLCFSIRQHSYRSKYYILGSSILQKILLLLKAKDSYLRLAAIRVFRTCVGMKDDFYNRHLAKHDVFGPIIIAFRETKGRYNMINSACLDLFEFIRKVCENVKLLVASIASLKSQFTDMTFVSTFKDLLLRHEQNMEPPSVENGTTQTRYAKTHFELSRRRGDGWGKLDDEEEAYFNSSDNEDDANKEAESEEFRGVPGANQAQTSADILAGNRGPLVDYPEDED
ncbi:component of IIS longevity pathway SMK-1-domain-containing protein, partial [Zopfochytrium polystomum]